MKHNIFVYAFLIAVMLSLLAIAGCSREVETTTTSQPTGNDTPKTYITVITNPVEVVSVRSVQDPSGLVNPGGPTVEITLKNISGEDITGLEVTMDEGAHRVYNFGFGISRTHPLSPGSLVSSERILIGGGFGGEPPFGSMSYVLTINGTMKNRNTFGFTWESPGYTAAATEGGQQ